jgi:hypothetical protein
MIEGPHHYIVMPSPVYESGFSLSAFNHEATFLVGADCALIVGKHPYADPMQVQFGEGMLQEKRDGFASKTFAE